MMDSLFLYDLRRCGGSKIRGLRVSDASCVASSLAESESGTTHGCCLVIVVCLCALCYVFPADRSSHHPFESARLGRNVVFHAPERRTANFSLKKLGYQTATAKVVVTIARRREHRYTSTAQQSSHTHIHTHTMASVIASRVLATSRVFVSAAAAAKTPVFPAISATRFFSAKAETDADSTTSTTAASSEPPHAYATGASKVITSNVVEETRLHPALKKAFIKNVGPTLTPVQEQCINEFITSENGIVVRAKTGTGKTFAFGIPVMHSVLNMRDEDSKIAGRYVNSVIFAPTRDLAYQTRQSLSNLWAECTNAGKKDSVPRSKRNDYPRKSRSPRDGNSEDHLIPLVIGQTPYRATMNHFVGKEVPPIVVATPGRFMDMLENEPKFRTSFKHLQNVIIDEADELLNGNFKEDINRIIDELQAIREPIPGIEDASVQHKAKTMLFSATVNDDVFALAERAISNDFPFVDVTGTKTQEVNENITQTLIQTESIFDTYVAAIKFLLDHAKERDFKPIIFLSTTTSVDFISKLVNDVFRDQNIRRRVLSFHGKLSQGKRDASQRIFRENDNTVLVASGIGARGMDFPNVSHVIQIGVSSEIDSHTHKIGRTGRAGKKGDALLFTSKMEEPFVKALKKNGNKFTEVIEFDGAEQEAVEVADAIKDQTRSYMDLNDTFFSSLTHYRNIPSRVANLNLTSLAIDLAKCYKELSTDADVDVDADEENSAVGKMSMSYTAAKHLGLDFDRIEPYYELSGRRPANSRGGNNNRVGKNNNRNGKRNDWSNDRRGSYGGNNDRRGGDRRGGYGGNNDRRGGGDNYQKRESRW